MTATAVATREDKGAVVSAPRSAIALLRPIAEPSAVLESQEQTRTMVSQILQKDRDFGVIPGTDKPSMLKPGAERVALAFGCYYGEPVIVEKDIDHDRVVEYTKRKKVWRNQFRGDREFTWAEEHGTSRGLYRYVVRVDVINRATGEVVGSAIGSCSTMESKYIDRPRDSENTALKMAHKRALVGACLITFGLSDQFTQDVEDIPKEALHGEGAPELPAMDPPCPKCGGKMWDNRLSKKKPTHPDFKCKKGKECDGVVWPPREGEQPSTTEGEHRDFNGSGVEGQHPGAGADQDGVSQDPLDLAMDVRLPGGPKAWGGKGGTPISQLSVKMLDSVRGWCVDRLAEAGTELDDAAADPVKVKLIRAIDLVLPHKKAEAEKDQTKLDLTGDPVKDAAAAQKTQEGKQRPDPTTASSTPASAPASSATSTKPSKTPSPAGQPTTSSKPTAATEPAKSFTQLVREIESQLSSADRTDAEKVAIRAKIDGAKSLEELQAILTDVSFPC